VRLGLRLTKGLANGHGARIVLARGDRPFVSVDEMWRRVGVAVIALGQLATAGAFRSLGLDRRQAEWAIRALRDDALPLFKAADERRNELAPEIVEAPVDLAPMTAGADVVEDYGSTGLSLRQHPVAFLRRDLDSQGILPASKLTEIKDGRRVKIAGLVLVRQAAGIGEGRAVHHDRGRRSNREPHRMARPIRAQPPRRAVGVDAGRARAGAARGRGDPRRL
jgi:error-prone DNA polymerase